jgi:hypothetical protein
VSSDPDLTPLFPRLISRPWFGPRRAPNWGWRPLTWQGWAASGVFLVAVVACGEVVHGIPKAIVEVGLIVLLLLVCLLTGTRPGWRR